MDYVSSQSKRDFVMTELRSFAGPKKETANSTFIICPYHAERTPSGRVFHYPASSSAGSFRCYGCGAKASWNELAVKLGLKPFKGAKPVEEYAHTINMPTEDEVENDFEDFTFKDLPRNKLWREIPTNLLIDVGCKLISVYGQSRLYMPVLVKGKLEGYIKARLRKSSEHPSYINAKGRWSKLKGLFPYDYSIALMQKLGISTMVLVEGQRDALRLLASGIPALCILGTQSWTLEKQTLLELGGVDSLIVLMDGDDAGIAATETIKDMSRLMFNVKVLKLWAIKNSPYLAFKDEDEPSKAAKLAGVVLWDPGNMPEYLVRKLKTIIMEN